MLRQIIVFTKNANLPTIMGLIDAGQRQNIQISPVNPFQETTWCSNLQENLPFTQGESALLLIRTSGIEFDDWDLHLAESLEKKGHKLATPLSTTRLLRNKDAQTLWLSDQGLPHVPTLIQRGPLSLDILENWQKSDEFVLKSVRGNKGIGILKLTKEELVSHWQRKTHDQRYLIQPFIKGKEFRHLVLGREHFFIEKIGLDEEKEWRRNSEFALFKEADPNSFDMDAQIKMAQKIQETLGLKSFAIDLLESNDGLQILEINANPGLMSASQVFSPSGGNLFDLYLASFSN